MTAFRSRACSGDRSCARTRGFRDDVGLCWQGGTEDAGIATSLPVDGGLASTGAGSGTALAMLIGAEDGDEAGDAGVSPSLLLHDAVACLPRIVFYSSLIPRNGK